MFHVPQSDCNDWFPNFYPTQQLSEFCKSFLSYFWLKSFEALR